MQQCSRAEAKEGQRMRFVLLILPTTTTTTTRREYVSNEGQETLKSPWGIAISYRHGPSLLKLHGANNEKMVIHADSSPIVTLQIPLPKTLGDEAPKHLGQKQGFRRLQRGWKFSAWNRKETEVMRNTVQYRSKG